jgi:hypothetical protein
MRECEMTHSHLKLAGLLPISLEDDGHQVIAYAPGLRILGYGDAKSEALDDLWRTIADLYHTLQEEQESLGPMPTHVWNYLAHTIVESEP